MRVGPRTTSKISSYNPKNSGASILILLTKESNSRNSGISTNNHFNYQQNNQLRDTYKKKSIKG